MVKFVIRGECSSSTEANEVLNDIRRNLDTVYRMQTCKVHSGRLYPVFMGSELSDNKTPHIFEVEYMGDFERKNKLLFRDLDEDIQSHLSKILCWYTYDFELKEI